MLEAVSSDTLDAKIAEAQKAAGFVIVTMRQHIVELEHSKTLSPRQKWWRRGS
jgi:hypothetical protein